MSFKFLKHKSNSQNYRPVILITGCASGIGLAIAQILQRENIYRLVLTAREKSIPELKKHFQEDENIMLRVLDVIDDHARNHLVNEVVKLWEGVDILVNNAGISYRAVIEQMTEKDELLQISTNYLGPMGLIRLVLPGMRERGRGKIINISSVAGMMAMPTMASYSASKHALEGASESLWYETRPFGITVSLVQPGFIHSNSFQNVYHTALSKPTLNWEGPYAEIYANMTPFVARLMNLSLTTPEKIAKIVLCTIQTQNPPLWIPATLDASLFYYIRRLFPRRLLLPFLYFCLPHSGRWGSKHTHKRS
jgi:short-subunit dehydrogenase